MREIWFVRHGQSTTNVGLPSKSDKTTPLTDLGVAQAEFVARAIDTPPDLFVVSPYLRTSQTAGPTLNKFSDSIVETWPIQEFSYLSYAQYEGTTTRDRRRLSFGFFRKADPDLVLGEGGESFNQFIQRVRVCYERLVAGEHEKTILFGHGWFMRAGLWTLLRDSKSEKERISRIDNINKLMTTSKVLFGLYGHLRDRTSMKSFLLFSASVETPNCSILKYRVDEKTGDMNLFDFDVSHLPEDLRKTSLRNR